MLEQNGVPGRELLATAIPSPERRARGPVAVVECFQRIPCNPCAGACPQGAIMPFNDINDLPRVDVEKCNGCGLCVSACPGLAIFVIDETYSPGEALVKLPYEMWPLPAPGSEVTALNREGSPVGAARVVRVQSGERFNHTAVVWLAVPRELAMEVRNFASVDRSLPVDGIPADGSSLPPGEKALSDQTVICRCEDITLGQIRARIAEGVQTPDELKRLLRCGMGPCQGKTCGPLILREIAAATGSDIARIPLTTFRPPTKPVKLGALAGGEDGDE